MSLRTPLAVAVVGALLVGGATTGTTLALWQDQTSVDNGQLVSGEMAFSVQQGGDIELGDLSLVQGGAAVSVTGTVTDESPAGAQNLRQDIRLTGVTLAGADGGLTTGHLLLEVTPKPASGCSSEVPGTAAAGYTSSVLGQTVPGDTFEICVRVAATANAPVGGTGTVDLDFTGVQVR